MVSGGTVQNLAIYLKVLAQTFLLYGPFPKAMKPSIDDYLVIKATSSNNEQFITDPVNHLLSKGFRRVIEEDYTTQFGHAEEKSPTIFMKMYESQPILMHYTRSYQALHAQQWRTERNYQISGIAKHLVAALDELGLDPEKKI